LRRAHCRRRPAISRIRIAAGRRCPAVIVGGNGSVMLSAFPPCAQYISVEALQILSKRTGFRSRVSGFLFGKEIKIDPVDKYAAADPLHRP